MTLLELRLLNARLRLAEVSRLTEELITCTEGDPPGKVSLELLDNACEDLQWAVGQAMRTQHDLRREAIDFPATSAMISSSGASDTKPAFPAPCPRRCTARAGGFLLMW